MRTDEGLLQEAGFLWLELLGRCSKALGRTAREI